MRGGRHSAPGRPAATRWPILALAALVALGTLGAYALSSDEPQEQASGARVRGMRPCDVPVEVLERVWRGYTPQRSGDVLTVEWAPNQFGGVRHSTPWPYTQDVPLLLYGPGYIRRGATSSRPVTVADIAPTFAELLRFEDFPRRDGRVLDEALLPRSERNGVPRLIFTLVWDGGGDNLLRRWPHAWPNLRRLTDRSTVYEDAAVGSSPSITPAIHATLGTGVFPARHGQPDMEIRIGDELRFVWQGASPQYLETKTLADLWDAARGNAPLVGVMARDTYHLGMIGHGAFLPEGDHDVAVFDDLAGTSFRTNEDFYSLPEYLRNSDGLEEAIDAVDLRDGKADRRWLGNRLVIDDPFLRYTPVWPIYQSDRLADVLEGEGFGSDEIPDLFFTNYKGTDLAGHYWNLVEPEEEAVLREQDRQLEVLLGLLDRLVGRGNYVLALTADHGISPYPRVTGGWAIEGGEVTSDIERRFDDDGDERSLILSNRGYQIFLHKGQMRRNGVTPEDISAFLRDYRVEDNVTSTNKLLPRFANRTQERLFLTALTPGELKAALACARGAQG
ncbi:MAG: alkaline phosphatase family protein [Actinomycetota bacterium]